MTNQNPPVARRTRLAAGPLRLGPSPFGHRSLVEDLPYLADERTTPTPRTPRPGAGIRAATDARVVTSALVFTSPRTLTSPRVFAEPRAITGIRATTDR